LPASCDRRHFLFTHNPQPTTHHLVHFLITRYPTIATLSRITTLSAMINGSIDFDLGAPAAAAAAAGGWTAIGGGGGTATRPRIRVNSL